MANFQPAVQNTELWEGGYSNNPADHGGETYRGISRNNWPNWAGWARIDCYTKVPALGTGSITDLDKDALLQALVVDFYHTNFWHYDGIQDQAVANKLFDLCVNVGPRHGVKIVQQAVGVNPDGVYGPATEAAINAASNLLPAIRQAAESYHEQIVNVHPEDAVFLRGWLRRDAS